MDLEALAPGASSCRTAVDYACSVTGRGYKGGRSGPRLLAAGLVATLTLAVAILGPTTVAGEFEDPGQFGPGGWDRLGDGGTPGTPSLNGDVHALNVDVPDLLYVGGQFTDAGGNADADRIATWNGGAWEEVGPGLNTGGVFAIAHDAGRVFAGGSFTNAGGDANADFLAVWDGVSWEPFCNAPTGLPAFNGNVKALQVIGSTLYVGGEFQNAAGIAEADGLVECDLSSGEADALVAIDGESPEPVYALTADDNGVLYAGGDFINADGIDEADYVARWSGTSWAAMGSRPGPPFGAVTGIVRSLTADGTDVYVGSDASDMAQIPQADHVAKWDGTEWSAIGSDTSGANGWFPALTSIEGMITARSSLFVIGAFQNANGDPRADVVASFDAGAWHPVGSNGAGDGPLNASGHVLAFFDRLIYAGGNFTSAGGDPLARRAASTAIGTPPTPTPTVTPGPSAAPTPLPTAPPPPLPTPTPTAPPPPEVTLSGSTVQALDKTIRVAVACDEACTATVTGSLVVPNAAKLYRLRKATKRVPAGGKRKLRLKVPRKVRRAARNALRQGSKVRARIKVTVRGATGISSSTRRTVKLKL